jgi:hypothetical protein
VNSDSGIVNTYSGEGQKAFTFKQNQCSRCARITVHVRPEWVFTLIQNNHLENLAAFAIVLAAGVISTLSFTAYIKKVKRDAALPAEHS